MGEEGKENGERQKTKIQLLHCWYSPHCSQFSDTANLDESNYHSLLHKEEKA